MRCRVWAALAEWQLMEQLSPVATPCPPLPLWNCDLDCSAPSYMKFVGLVLFSTSFPSFRIGGGWPRVTEGREWGEGRFVGFLLVNSRMLSLAWLSVWLHNPEFEQKPLSKNPVFRVLELCTVHCLMSRKKPKNLIFKCPSQPSCSKKICFFCVCFYITAAAEQLRRTVDKRGNVFILLFSC